MADEKNKNEDPEEEKDDQFDDDEDFGLPDLEYDELDDEGEESDESEEPEAEEEQEPEPAPEPEEEEPKEEEPAPVASEEDQPDLEAEFEGLDINPDEDIDTEATEDWEKELEKELEEELKAEGGGGAFYEEESYEEFESEGEEMASSVFDSDEETAGFDDGGVGYAEPEGFGGNVESDAGGGTTGGYISPHEQQSNKGKFVRTVVLGTLLFAVIAVVFFLLYDGGDGKDKKVAEKKPAKTAPVEKKEEPKEEPKEVKPEPVAEKPKPKPAQQKTSANTKPAGEIITLEQQTGKTYIIIGSFFDGDLANDYAQKLAKDGKSPMVIPPFKEYRFHRVAIAEFDRFSDAQRNLDGYKNEYGPEIWPLRY